MQEVNPFSDIIPVVAAGNSNPQTQQYASQVSGGTTRFESISVGAGATCFRADQSGIWLGAEKWADAPFKVDMNGNLYATSATLNGYTKNADVTTIIGNTVTTGYVNALNVTANSVSAGWVYAGNISANQINTGTLNASLITVTNLNADNITAGTITATRIASLDASKIGSGTFDTQRIPNLDCDKITTGTLIGRNIQSSSGNERVVLDNGDYIKFYAGNALKCQLRGTTAGSGGLSMTGDLVLQNNKRLWVASTGGGSSEYGGIGVDDSNRLLVSSGTANTMYFTNNSGSISDDNLLLTLSHNQAYHPHAFQANEFKASSGDLNLTPEGSGKVKMNSNINLNEKNLDGGQTLWAYNFSNRSDRNLKKNIVDLDSNLDKLMQLQPVIYHFKKQKNTEPKHIGLIAQDVEAVFPNIIATADDGFKGINYNELIPIVIKSIQELNQKIESIRPKVLQ